MNSLISQLVKNSPEKKKKKKTLPAMRETWVGKIPWRRGRLPTQICWPGEFRGLHSQWGHKESDRTEPLSLSQ